VAATRTPATHGATPCLGVMSSDGAFTQAGAGAFAVWDPEGDYGTGISALAGDPEAAARTATKAALAQAGRDGEAPDLIWLSAAPGAEEAILRGIEGVVGTNVPILGGSAADDRVAGAWQVFDGTTQIAAGVIVSVLFPSTDIRFAYHNGYAPTENVGIVTAGEGRKLLEIDGQPAAEVYRRWTQNAAIPSAVETPQGILSESTLSPLGQYLDRVGDVPYYLLVHPSAVTPGGALELFADVNVGDRLVCMAGSVESLTARAGKVAALAADEWSRGGAVAGALMVYCGGCMLAVQNHLDHVGDGVRDALPGGPCLGIFTLGEQRLVLDGRRRPGNA